MIRKVLFIISLWAGGLVAAQTLSAQEALVLTKDNVRFGAPGDNFPYLYIKKGSYTVPSGGTNMVWDYSAAELRGEGYDNTYLQSDNPELTEATYATDATFALNTFQLTGKSFYRAEESGEYYYANQYNAVTFDLGLGTLDIPYQTVPNVGLARLHLPATYLSTWNYVHKAPLSTILNVPLVGLVNAPLTYIETNIGADTVIGWGKLKLPGGGSFDVLLKKQTRVTIDSFYLGPDPAPTELLDLFGVTQGTATTTSYYQFYTTGQNEAIMTVYSGPNGEAYSYRSNLDVSGIEDRTETHIATRLYPNPVGSEGTSLEFEKSSSEAWSVLLLNTLGETIQTIPVTSPAGAVRTQINLPPSTPNGICYYEIRDENGMRKGMGKFVFEAK